MRFKRCRDCLRWKVYCQFYAMAGMRDGYRNECKQCNLDAKKRRYDADPKSHIARVQRWRGENTDRYLATQRRNKQTPEGPRRERAGHLRRKYGITLEQYDAMLEAQGGVCAICGRLPREDISLHVDHEHGSNLVRGLLCFRCNQAIGAFSEDPATLGAAARYLTAASLAPP